MSTDTDDRERRPPALAPDAAGRDGDHPARPRRHLRPLRARSAPVPTSAVASRRSAPRPPDAATIVIRPGADWAGHVPGQYLRIGIDVDGVREWRAYSLTHGPRADGRISITVKAVPDGKVSNHLVHEAVPGTLVHLEQAAGDFVLKSDHDRLLFVTAGSGITPVIGMLRNLFPSTDDGRPAPRPEQGPRHRRRPRRPERARLDLHPRPAVPGRRWCDHAHRALRRRARCPRRRRARRPGARPGRAPYPRVRPGRTARRPRGPPRATPASSWSPSSSAPRGSSPATAARWPSPTAPRSSSTAPPRSSTRPRRPAS